MIGKLQYVVHYKPDIALSVVIVARLFANPRENDAGASGVFLVTTLEFMGGGSIVSLEGSCTSSQYTLELGTVYVARHGLWLLGMI